VLRPRIGSAGRHPDLLLAVAVAAWVGDQAMRRLVVWM
jgi:hypothetical protein